MHGIAEPELKSQIDDRNGNTIPVDRATPLPPGYTPGPWTVICGRGKQWFNHGTCSRTET